MVSHVASAALAVAPTAVVEVVGLAGAGKTTVARALSDANPRFTVAPDLSLRKATHLVRFAAALPRLLPQTAPRTGADRWLQWDELKAVGYLTAWPALLRRRATLEGGVILLDHGPIFKLATLRAFGPPRFNDGAGERWLRQRIAEWRATLDIVIWLDAPLPTLLARIDGRAQKHAIKGKDAAVAADFLQRYRAAYTTILQEITAAGRPTLLKFNTAQLSSAQLAAQIAGALTQRSEISR